MTFHCWKHLNQAEMRKQKPKTLQHKFISWRMPGMIGVTYILAKHYRSYNPGRLHCGAAFKASDAGKASGPSTTGLDKPFAT